MEIPPILTEQQEVDQMAVLPWENGGIEICWNKRDNHESNPAGCDPPKLILLTTELTDICFLERESFVVFINHSTYGFNVIHVTNIQINSTSLTPTYQAIEKVYKNIQLRLSNIFFFKWMQFSLSRFPLIAAEEMINSPENSPGT